MRNNSIRGVVIEPQKPLPGHALGAAFLNLFPSSLHIIPNQFSPVPAVGRVGNSLNLALTCIIFRVIFV